MIMPAAQGKPSDMYSVEIHTPISMNEHFSVMCYLFVKSVAENAGLPGDWRVIYTVSGDSNLSLESSQFAWARDYPVEFQPVDPELWKAMGYVGTGLQGITTPHTADAVLYMDADMIVTGSLADVTRQVAGDHAIFGWPAWFSGDLPFHRLFEAAGIPNAENFRIVLTDDGADYADPWWPPYFNFGFIGVSRDLANHMARTFPRDQVFVMEHFENYFAGQVALALNIARNRYPYRILDERYNVGSDHPVALAHYERKLGRPMYPSAIANEDPRVMHYCFPTPTLEKKRDMQDWNALRRFVERPGLAGSEKVIQDALRKLDLFSPRDSYQRACGVG